MPEEETIVWGVLIPGYFPASLNKTHYAHWTKVRKHKAAAAAGLAHACYRGGGYPRFIGPVAVKIWRIMGKGQRAWDAENLVGGLKPLLDSMRARKVMRNQHRICSQGGLGIFQDDDPKDLRLEETEQIRWNDPATRELIEGLNLIYDRAELPAGACLIRVTGTEIVEKQGRPVMQHAD